MFRYDPQRSGHSTTTAPITNPILWSYEIGSFIDASPVVADGKVYVGFCDRGVYCLDSSSGSLIWNYMTGWLVLSSPAVANGRVYIGSYDESVYCFGSIPPVAVTASVNDVTVMKKSLNLAWTRSTDPQFAKYEVFRSVSSGVLGTSIADITNITTTNMDITGLSPSTTYYFTVRIWNTFGLYSDSTQISVTTAAPPTAVTVSPSAVTKNSLSLTWGASSESFFARYEVYQSAIQGNLGTLIETITSKTTTSLTVDNLSQGTTYYFTVRTIDSEGLYADSTQIAVTTALPLWLQPWFLGLIVAVIAIVIIVVVLLMRKKKTPPPPPTTGTT
jgi:outer membrane protein assembly factor BamB